MQGRQVVVHSWDFDGMLTSNFYFKELNNILEKAKSENRNLTEYDYMVLVAKIIEQPGYKEFFDARFGGQNAQKEHVVFVGSNRQSISKDIMNGFKSNRDKTLSAFPVYAALVKYLNHAYGCQIQLDKLLLEDVAKGLPPGTTFDAAGKVYANIPAEYFADKNSQDIKEEMYNTFEIDAKSPEHILDEEKGLVIYTQMHYANNKYGTNADVEFDFADDRSDILNNLNTMFDSHKNLLPVNLHLTQFVPPDRKENVPITTRTIVPPNKENNKDPQPFETYRSMLEQAKSSDKNDEPKLYDRNKYESENVKNYDNLTKMAISRAHNTERSQTEVIHDLVNLFNDLSVKGTGINKMRVLLDQYGKSSSAARVLPDELLKQLQKIANQSLNKKYVGSGIFQLKRDPLTERLYKTIKELNVSNPSSAAIIDMHKEGTPEHYQTPKITK